MIALLKYIRRPTVIHNTASQVHTVIYIIYGDITTKPFWQRVGSSQDYQQSIQIYTRGTFKGAH